MSPPSLESNTKVTNMNTEMLTDPEMSKMAAKDIEQLEANMVSFVKQIKGHH